MLGSSENLYVTFCNQLREKFPSCFRVCVSIYRLSNRSYTIVGAVGKWSTEFNDRTFVFKDDEKSSTRKAVESGEFYAIPVITSAQNFEYKQDVPSDEDHDPTKSSIAFPLRLASICFGAVVVDWRDHSFGGCDPNDIQEFIDQASVQLVPTTIFSLTQKVDRLLFKSFDQAPFAELGHALQECVEACGGCMYVRERSNEDLRLVYWDSLYKFPKFIPVDQFDREDEQLRICNITLRKTSLVEIVNTLSLSATGMDWQVQNATDTVLLLFSAGLEDHPWIFSPIYHEDSFYGFMAFYRPQGNLFENSDAIHLEIGCEAIARQVYEQAKTRAARVMDKLRSLGDTDIKVPAILPASQNLLCEVIGETGLRLYAADVRYNQPDRVIDQSFTTRWVILQNAVSFSGARVLGASVPIEARQTHVELDSEGQSLLKFYLSDAATLARNRGDECCISTQENDNNGLTIQIANRSGLRGFVYVTAKRAKRLHDREKQFVAEFAQALFNLHSRKRSTKIHLRFDELTQKLIRVIDEAIRAGTCLTQLPTKLHDAVHSDLCHIAVPIYAPKDVLPAIYCVHTLKHEYSGKINVGSLEILDFTGLSIEIDEATKREIGVIIERSVEDEIPALPVPGAVVQAIGGIKPHGPSGIAERGVAGHADAQFSASRVLYGNLLSTSTITVGYMFVDTDDRIVFEHSLICELFDNLSRVTRNLSLILDYRHKNMYGITGNVVWRNFGHDAHNLLRDAKSAVERMYGQRKGNSLATDIEQAWHSHQRIEMNILRLLNQGNDPAIESIALVTFLEKVLKENLGQQDAAKWLNLLPRDQVCVSTRKQFLERILSAIISNTEKRWRDYPEITVSVCVQVLEQFGNRANAVMLVIGNDAVGSSFPVAPGAGKGYANCQEIAGRAGLAISKYEDDKWFEYQLLFFKEVG